jgi:hypothetical protein
MKSRLFHTIVVCGAGMGLLPLACAADGQRGSEASEPDAAAPSDAGAAADAADIATRCRLLDGGCDEHCSALADGGCLDPCFVHTTSCSPDCLRLDGSCGWPPTK